MPANNLETAIGPAPIAVSRFRIVVLGAGISGLSAAWFLKQKHGKLVDITLIEKNGRPGGLIQSVQQDGFLFEKGPRSCRTKGNGRATLELIEQLGLQNEVIPAHPSALKRYLFENGQLKQLRTSSLLFSGLKALWQDWRMPAGPDRDQTISEFFKRRIGLEWTERFIDPLVNGIYAGDINTLSVKSCFPRYFQWEQQYGSLLKGALKQKRKSPSATPFVSRMEKTPIFSFKHGMETLPLALAGQLDADILYHSEIVEISSDKVVLKNGRTVAADLVISSLPAEEIEYATVGVVNLGYRSKVINQAGFGYLIARREKEQILGCVFDSSVFPRNTDETCLTIMLGGALHQEVSAWNHEKCLFTAQEAARRHLGIQIAPDKYSISIAKRAIPQFQVGHSQWVDEAKKEKGVYRIGSSISGVAINDCIVYAKNLADDIVVC